MEIKRRILVYGLSDTWGGVESIVTSLIVILQKWFTIDVIIPTKKCSYLPLLQNNGISYFIITSWGKNPCAFRSELKQVYHNQYDYIWINSSIRSNRDIITITRKYSSAKIITHSHGSSFEEKSFIKSIILRYLHNFNKRYYLKNIDYACCCSLLSASWFYGNNYIKSHRMILIKNGIDFKKFSFDDSIRTTYRKIFSFTDDQFVILHVGRLCEVKNQRKLIDIFSELVKINQKAILLIAGTGELYEELSQYTNSLHLQNEVMFLSSRDDIHAIMQAADCFVLPSFHEGFPVTLTEAQASGLECFVSSNISKEVDIAECVHFIDLSMLSSEWAKIINQTTVSNISVRIERGLKVKTKGYDIAEVASFFANTIK